jgi:hypothetical protein
MSVTNRYVKRSIILEAKFVDLVEIEIGESSLGAKGVKGKRGRGAYGKTPVFGIFQRGGSVYTEIVPDYA